MPELISKRDLRKMPVTDYKSLRNMLQTGDIIFCSGNYPFSRAIQFFTKSAFSHVGIIYKDEKLDRILVLESEAGVGVRLAPLSKYIRDYHGKNLPYKGQIVLCRSKTEIPFEQLKYGIGFGLDELTKPYDNIEILRILMRTILGLGKRTQDRSYICSELIYEIYKKAKFEFKYRNRQISPNDLWVDERLDMLWRIL